MKFKDGAPTFETDDLMNDIMQRRIDPADYLDNRYDIDEVGNAVTTIEEFVETLYIKKLIEEY